MHSHVQNAPIIMSDEITQSEAIRHAAMESIWRRMDEITECCGARFPLFRVASAENWTCSRRGSWIGGFWAGLWWLRARITERGHFLESASNWCAKLSPVLKEESVNRSFVFWYGAALGAYEMGDQEAGSRASHAAMTIEKSFDDSLGLWPLGQGLGGGSMGPFILDIDSLAPLLQLMNVFGGLSGRVKARRHLDTCLSRLQMESGVWLGRVRIHGGQECDEIIPCATGGARIQAWAMLGLADAARLYDEAVYRDAALRACSCWCERYGRNDRDCLVWDEYCDPCAYAISSVAMFKLWRLLPECSWLRNMSYGQIDGLLVSRYFTSGRFEGHLYRTDHDRVQLVESPCATFYLLEAIMLQMGGDSRLSFPAAED